MAIPKKPRTCRVCKTVFRPCRCLQTVCGPECAIKQAGLKRAKIAKEHAKNERQAVKIRKEAARPMSYYANKAQTAVNSYRRALLDAEPCISCGRHHKGQYHAGHYVSRGASPALRYEHLNIWKQCQPCNTAKSGNCIEYRKALVARIGVEKVEWLEGPHELPRWRKEDYQRIEAEHKQLLKELRK